MRAGGVLAFFRYLAERNIDTKVTRSVPQPFPERRSHAFPEIWPTRAVALVNAPRFCWISVAHVSGREKRVIPFFVQIKCHLGKAYSVANALADAEIASEIYYGRRFRPPGQVLR